MAAPVQGLLPNLSWRIQQSDLRRRCSWGLSGYTRACLSTVHVESRWLVRGLEQEPFPTRQCGHVIRHERPESICVTMRDGSASKRQSITEACSPSTFTPHHSSIRTDLIYASSTTRAAWPHPTTISKQKSAASLSRKARRSPRTDHTSISGVGLFCSGDGA